MKRNEAPQPKARIWLASAIPLGFIVLVGAMVLYGNPGSDAPVSPEASPTEDATQASSSPLTIDDVSDPALETNTVEAEPMDRYDDQAGAVTPTPSGPEGRDNDVIFEN